MIRDVVPADSTAIAKIYNHYVERTDITFETELIDPSEMLERIQSTLSRDFPWIVKLNDAEEVVGYAYADLWRKRIAYRCSVESAIYVSCDQVGKGFGKSLYEALLDRLQESGNVHVVIGVIAVPNEASVGLHRRLGFKEGGLYREVGRKFDRWVEVQTLQLQMEVWRADEAV